MLRQSFIDHSQQQQMLSVEIVSVVKEEKCVVEYSKQQAFDDKAFLKCLHEHMKEHATPIEF